MKLATAKRLEESRSIPPQTEAQKAEAQAAAQAAAAQAAAQTAADQAATQAAAILVEASQEARSQGDKG